MGGARHRFMLAKVASSFRIKTKDPGALAMRLGKVSDPKNEWFNTAAKDVVNLSGRNPWRPVRAGYSVYDASMALGQGIYRLPLLDKDDKAECLLSQSSLMKIINDDPKNRLGKMKSMTADELGGKKDVVTISIDAMAMDAFDTLDKSKVTAVAVVNDAGVLVEQVDADSLKMIGVQFGLLARPLYEVRSDLLTIFVADSWIHARVVDRRFMSSVARKCGRGTPHPPTSSAQTSPPSCPCAHPTTAAVLELEFQTCWCAGGHVHSDDDDGGHGREGRRRPSSAALGRGAPHAARNLLPPASVSLT